MISSVMDYFQDLLDGIDPRNPTDEDFAKCETFMARTYNSNKATLDKVRVSALLACDKPEDCPPTSNAAKFHISRSFCQAAKLHYADLANHHDNLPSPISSGGHKLDRGTLVPIMMTTEPVPNSIVEDITCICKTMCDTKKCSCRANGYKCSLLCHKNLKYDHSNCMNWNEN